MSFRKAIAIAFVLALGISAASAKEPAIKVNDADKAACMPDAFKLCRDAIPDVHRVMACMGKNRNKLSNGCRAAMASYGM